MFGQEIWVGLVEVRRSQPRIRPRKSEASRAFVTVLARARHRVGFRRRAAEHVQERGWRLDAVVHAAPLEKWLSISDSDVDDLEVRDSVQDAKDDAELRVLARDVATDGVSRSVDWDVLRDEGGGSRSWNERLGNWAWQLLWWVGVPIFAAFTFPFLVQDIGPAYRAQFGHGTSGVFIATDRQCGKTCSSTGNWTANDGSRSRRHVTLASGAGAPRPGEKVAAIDVGDRVAVFPAKGGWDWLLITAILGVVTALTLTWIYLLVRRVRERWTS